MAAPFFERDLDAPFLPLNKKAPAGYETLLMSIEGPNGVGKSAIWPMTMQFVAIAHTYSYQECTPPIVGVAEPPAIKIKAGSEITYRNVAKSNIPLPGLVNPDELKDQLFKARVFCKGRREIERLVVYNFPFPRDSYTYPWLVFPSGTNLPQSAGNLEQLRQVGFAEVLKDRGSGTTTAFQGNSDKANEVREFLAKAYSSGYLKREHLTLLIMPWHREEIKLPEWREEKEHDTEVRPNEVALYRKLKEERAKVPFTSRIVELSNDRTGIKNKVSSTAIFATLMILATEQEYQGKLEIKEGVPFEVAFPLLRFLWEAGERYDLQSTFGADILFHKMLMGDIQHEGFRSGDVAILDIGDEKVRMVVSPESPFF